MDWKEEYRSKLRTADEAVKIVRNNDVVHIGTASSVAYVLADALYRRRDELENVTISSGVNTRLQPFYTDEDSPFKVLTYFAGPAERAAMKLGRCSYTSLHLSQIDKWCEGMLSGGVAFIEVSLPDRFGYMSYGAYGVAMHDDVVQSVDRVVLQVNKNVPYVYGVRNTIHVSQADYIVEADDALAQVPDLPVDEVTRRISEYIVEQIPDGATIQLGLGGLSGAVGFGLQNKNDLGVHSEMYTNSMMHLAKIGVINNRRKNFMPGKSLAGFALGSHELYEYVNHNPEICFAPYTYVNNPYVIGKNNDMISVNTAMAIDLFGQVAADSMGGHQQSAVGGQVDYVRGAQLSKGGKSFIALPSELKKKTGNSSRIMAAFPPGTAVTTSRQDVQYVVTEYGCVNLKHLPAKERAKALIALAHPSYREELKDQAKELGIL